MNTTITPDALVQQWTPLLRKLAFQTGADFDDIQQEAWLLAATVRQGDDFMGRWLSAVRCHAAAQRPGVTVRPSSIKLHPGEEFIGSAWLAGSSPDDPAQIHQAVQDVARRVAGEGGDDTERWQRIRQEIELPRTSCELAEARGVSARQGRRDAARLRALEGVQAGLFDVDIDEPEGV